MRVATYNIRNVRAMDRASWWWRRRGAVRAVVAGLYADVVALQEAYPSQIRWLRDDPLTASEWQVAGRGRNAGGGGEAAPIFTRSSALANRTEVTRWFGPDPDRAGSRPPGAAHPRIATIADYDLVGDDAELTIANVHLDPVSGERRAASVDQLLGWLEPRLGGPMIVLGDFNGPLTESWHSALRAAGLRSALEDGVGPTANGFGAASGQQQIDHVFVSANFEVVAATIHTEAGHASDHYPVTVELR